MPEWPRRISEEMRQHLDDEYDALRAGGLGHDEAMRRLAGDIDEVASMRTRPDAEQRRPGRPASPWRTGTPTRWTTRTTPSIPAGPPSRCDPGVAVESGACPRLRAPGMRAHRPRPDHRRGAARTEGLHLAAAELVEIAEGLGIEDVGRLKKQEIIFRIFK